MRRNVTVKVVSDGVSDPHSRTPIMDHLTETHPISPLRMEWEQELILVKEQSRVVNMVLTWGKERKAIVRK